MHTLPAYVIHLRSSGYSESTIEKYLADVRRFSIFARGKTVAAVVTSDIQHWISSLLSPQGARLERKTVNRKASAIINYFGWLTLAGALAQDPSAALINERIQSPLPDYLYDGEIEALYAAAGDDSRTQLLVLLLLETGIKSKELLALKRAHVDVAARELWIKHAGRETKKDRKLALPDSFPAAYEDYVTQYDVTDVLFPYSERFVQLLFADLKKASGITKALTPKTLRHTHIVRAYRRGEDTERIFDRIGLSPDSRAEANEVYARLAGKGI